MLGLPTLQLRCQRCGKPREGIRHTCRSNSSRAATVKLRLDYGKCSVCGKSKGRNPWKHRCTVRTDFKKRRKAASKSAPKRSTSQRHEYSACPDIRNCTRAACIAYREGISTGRLEGYDEGYQVGFDIGIQSCPLNHGGS